MKAQTQKALKSAQRINLRNLCIQSNRSGWVGLKQLSKNEKKVLSRINGIFKSAKSYYSQKIK